MNVRNFGSGIQIHVDVDLLIAGIDQVGNELRYVDRFAGAGRPETHVVVVAH